MAENAAFDGFGSNLSGAAFCLPVTKGGPKPTMLLYSRVNCDSSDGWAWGVKVVPIEMSTPHFYLTILYAHYGANLHHLATIHTAVTDDRQSDRSRLTIQDRPMVCV